MTEDDKYTYPGSGGVLRNRFGITDQATLDGAMNRFASAGWATLATAPVTTFDLPYLQSVHRCMFAALFDWSGTLRDVNTVASGTGIVYARPPYIEASLEDAFDSLRSRNYLQGIPEREEFAKHLAAHWAYLTAIHPFRDGNTRTQSLYISKLAEAAGHPLDWRHVDVDALRHARLRAVQGHEGALAGLLHAATRPEQLVPVRMSSHSERGEHGARAGVPGKRCGRLRVEGRGLCARVVGATGCPYHR